MFWARIALCLALFASPALAQTNPGFVTGAILCANTGDVACQNVTPANPLGINQAFINKMDVTPVVPISFIGTNVNPLIVDGAQITVQNSSTTQANIYVPVTGGAVYDGIRSTVNVPAGSTVLSGNGVSSYVRNRSASGTAVFGNGVGFYGLVVCGVSGVNCWGDNLRLSDTEDNLGHGLTGIALAGSEIDFGIRNTATHVQGMALLGAAGNVQPAAAAGYTCGLLGTSSAVYWTYCFVIADNVANSVGVYVGTTAAQAANIPSAIIQMAVWDSTGIAEHGLNFRGIPFGTNSAFSFLDNIRANGLFLEMTQTGSPPSIGAQGTDTNIGILLAPKGTGQLGLGIASNTIASNVAHSFLGGATFSGPLTDVIVVSDAASTTGSAMTVGAQAASGTNVNSQNVKFRRFNGSGALVTDTLIDSSAGLLTWNGPAIAATEYIAVGAATVVSAGQIAYGGTTSVAASCGSIAGAAGCIVVNVAGTTRNVPFF